MTSKGLVSKFTTQHKLDMKQKLSSRFANVASHRRNGSTVKTHARKVPYMVLFDFEKKEVTILPYSQRKLTALGFCLIGDESRIGGVKLLSMIQRYDENYGAQFHCSEIFHGGEKRFYSDDSFSYHVKGLTYADALKVAKRLEVIARDPRKTNALRKESEKALEKERETRAGS